MSDSDPTPQTSEQAPQMADSPQPDASALPIATPRYLFSAAHGKENAQVHAADITPSAAPEFNAARVLVHLSEKQMTAIDLICLGKIDRVVAATIAVHPKTVTRWRLYHAGFRAELSRRRQEVFGIAQDRFREMLGKALDVVSQDLDDSDKLIRHRAARAMLSLSSKFEPPDEPIDPLQVVLQHARLLKRAMNSSDPMIETVYPNEQQDAERDLAIYLGDPEKEERSAIVGTRAEAPNSQDNRGFTSNAASREADSCA